MNETRLGFPPAEVSVLELPRAVARVTHEGCSWERR